MEPRSRTITTRFPAERARIRDLRHWAGEALLLLGLDNLQVDAVRDAVELVLSELGTNGIVHGCGGDRPDVKLTASLASVPGALRVSVADPGPGQPAYRRAADDETCGRGLILVMAHVSRFGVEGLPEGGKEVWTEVELPVFEQSAAAVAEQAARVCTVLRAGMVVRSIRPRPAVGTFPEPSTALDRIPA
ncbi:ATP-binding protein [Kitasatospora sp. NPDC005856]|uniref:ATP-binding protein n=1 Tax=Kitasatospora sp. NPDC005856 TaxID=3154566 RepID=UPI0033EF374B